MRPLRLHLDGFGAFSTPTDIDFTDVELFALTGPTGSGKTTVLDGFCFALYGSVPRHGKGRVAPIITQGRLEATVALDFAIDNTTYRVARRVKKDARRQTANTDEASFESDGHTVAVGADPVSEAITNLLGLDFDQFTTCVLLPQGEFARFLHDKPAERQELLTALLDLGIYDRVSTLATGRQRLADGRLLQIEAELARLGEVTTLDLETARAREKELEDLLQGVEEKLPAIESRVQAVTKNEVNLQLARDQAAVLGGLVPPSDWQEVGTEVAGQAEAEALARAELEAARIRLADLDQAGATHPARAQVQHWLRARSARLTAESDKAAASSAVSELAIQVTATEEQVTSAKSSLEAVIDADRAAHLRRRLKPGDPCPVCGEPISKVPRAGGSGKEIGRAEKLLAASESAAMAARESLAKERHRLEGLEQRIVDLGRQLVEAAAYQDLDVLSKTIEEHGAALVAGREKAEKATAAIVRLEQDRERLAVRRGRVKESLEAAWAKATPLHPPLFDGAEPVAGWAALLEWRDRRQAEVDERVNELERSLAEDVSLLERAQRELAELFEGMEVEVGNRSFRDAVVAALGTAGQRREQVAAALEEAARFTQDREDASLERDVAKQLTLVLRANKFRNWLFDEVFAALVAGANRLLSDLTRGQYQLAMAGRDFEVIDHLSAGNRRSVRTLSGGETFLVSLALAIALAEEVATSAGAHGLDSIFLDEGFGTLDTESLEVVAGVIAELGAQGKVVGIVTHVTELAEQMPIRYELAKGVDGASVRVVSS